MLFRKKVVYSPAGIARKGGSGFLSHPTSKKNDQIGDCAKFATFANFAKIQQSLQKCQADILEKYLKKFDFFLNIYDQIGDCGCIQ